MTHPTGTGRADVDIAVGRVGRAHGVRGEAFVQPWTDTPDERFMSDVTLRTEPASRGPLTIASTKMHSGKLVVHFVGVDSRSAAEALTGTVLLMASSERPPIADPDEFYDTDLIGLLVRDLSGTTIATVSDVLHSAAGSVLAIDIGGREALVPFRKAIVPEIDVARGYLRIDPPEGLLEL